MTETTANSLGDLVQALQAYHSDRSWIFRGQADASWLLIPKAGRPGYQNTDDWRVLEVWKREATGYLKTRPKDDWEWLAIAQHHGLATRLLDWTRNPLSAAYFALAENRSGDAVLCATRIDDRVMVDRYTPQESGPNKRGVVPRVAIVRPSAVVPRIVHQGGVFTFHTPPTLALSEGVESVLNLDHIVIPNASRAAIVADLSAYGINRRFLFPDLDGLASHLDWEIRAGEFFS